MGSDERAWPFHCDLKTDNTRVNQNYGVDSMTRDGIGYASSSNSHLRDQPERRLEPGSAACSSSLKTTLKALWALPIVVFHASAYSGGMMRRLNMSIALLHHPELVLLDEPTVGVDPLIRVCLQTHAAFLS